MSFRSSGVAAPLLISFLCAALAPCPARVEAGSRGPAGGTHRSESAGAAQAPAEERSANPSLVPACPCGCERAPLAGSSARVGVALPSAAPRLAAASAVAPTAPPERGRIEILASRIEHVPLPAWL